MFEMNQETLKELGAHITAKEIMQQPELWQEVWETYSQGRSQISQFLTDIKAKHPRTRVLFTGAGTSAYVGEIILPFLKEHGDEQAFEFQIAPTTSVVSNPKSFFKKEIPTILVSFARSGNSPESLATVDLATSLVDDLYQITITCAVAGKLSKRATDDAKNLLLLMPERSNDQGFAMTGSFSSMTLMSLLIFDEATLEQKANYVTQVQAAANEVISRENEIAALLAGDYKRVIYLGSGSLAGLAREVQLKILELTAGQIATLYDSPLGFRHGPKSFINEESLVFMFTSNDAYTRQYDLDLLKEVAADQIAPVVCSINAQHQTNNYDGTSFSLNSQFSDLPDAYLALAFAIFGQTVGILSALKLGNTPDTPSPTGTVNRVVEGVTIYHNFDE